MGGYFSKRLKEHYSIWVSTLVYMCVLACVHMCGFVCSLPILFGSGASSNGHVVVGQIKLRGPLGFGFISAPLEGPIPPG